jgi:hypothetical protein
MSQDEYNKLREKWYKKLKKVGFKDIEQEDGQLKSWDSFRFRKKARSRNDRVTTSSAVTHHQKADYYYYATHFLNDHTFEKEIHKLIWEQHSNGASIDRITKKIRKHRSINRNDIFNIIKHYRTMMLRTIK